MGNLFRPPMLGILHTGYLSCGVLKQVQDDLGFNLKTAKNKNPGFQTKPGLN